MFKKCILNDIDKHVYQHLLHSTILENVAKGRKGAIVVDSKEQLIPIVRTTSKYKNPPQPFQQVHYEIIKEINKQFNSYFTFNNVLVEMYNNEYKTMAFHSDQALDLCDDSYIALFSCYDIHDTKSHLRKLIVKKKTTNNDNGIEEIVLDHCSIVLFSTRVNAEYLHKIILDSRKDNEDVHWIGLTFRLSKTYVQFENGNPYLHLVGNSLQPSLRLANEDEEKIMYKQRSMENKKSDFMYSNMNFTLSKGDLLPIERPINLDI